MSETVQSPKGWKNITFTDIVKNEKYAIKRGPWGSSIKKDFFVPDGYKVYQQHNVIYDDFEFGDYFLDEKKFNELKEFEIKSGDFLISCSGTIGAIAVVPPKSKSGIMNQALLKISIDENKILSDYFRYFLNAPLFQNKLLSKGSAMKNIVSVKDLKKIIFAIPSLSIQKQITQKLDHVLGELDTKKKEIISLIEQNKERIDFFEKNWMSYVIEREIEKHPKRKEWELKKISQVCNVNPSKSEIKDLPDDTLVSFIPMRNVDDKDGIIKIHDEELLGKVRKGFTYFRNNDVIFAKITPCMENGKIAIGMNLKNDVGFGSTEFHVLRPHDQILSEFIHYFLRNKSFRVEAKQNFTGSAGQKRVPKDFLENHSIPIPSISVQRKIIQNIKSAEQKFKSQKKQFENIKNNYESKINYINHIQSSVLDSAFSGKLLN
jgi:type I restriction enzyme, S subunit